MFGEKNSLRIYKENLSTGQKVVEKLSKRSLAVSDQNLKRTGLVQLRFSYLVTLSIFGRVNIPLINP